MAHDDSGISTRRAIGISAALHLLLAPLFLSVPLFMGSGTSGGGGLTLDRESPVAILAIEHRPRAHRHQTVQVAHAPLRAAALPAAHRRIVAPRAIRDAVVPGAVAEAVAPQAAQQRESKAEGGPAQPSSLPGTPQPALEQQAAVVPTPAPTPSPVPTVAAQAVAMSQKPAPDRGSDAAAGGWGQNFDSPMLADDTALAELRAKYRVTGITIKVDENGHAVRVMLPSNVPADARDEIVARLTALHYVPAECNGLRCAGSLIVNL